jgi:tetratricopeptide (TPR) repeat protein
MCIISVAQAVDFYSVNDSLYSTNQLDKVKSNSLKELAENRESIEANYFLALVTLRQATNADSSRIYEKNIYVDRFQALYRDDAIAKRLMYGDQIMVSDPRFVKLFYYLGLKYMFEQDYNKAVEWLNLAEIGYEDSVDFNFYIGCSYHAIKNYDKAQKYYKNVLRLAPNHSESLYNMACLYAEFNNPDDSINWLNKAIKLDPKYKEMASKDASFDNIRKTPQYQRLMSK